VGALVKNIVISRDGVSNVAPLTTGNTPVPDNELNPNITPINKSNGEAQQQPNKQPAPRKKKDTVLPIINFSTPPVTKPSILEKKVEPTEEDKNK
jgi:hypothetical protein